MTIEAVRVAKSHRSQGIGQWMIRQAIEYGRNRGAKIIQLTTHKDRHQAKSFYEQLNFMASHEGMKLVLSP
jgi:ribosomal protein S18 acetylase RimI-like enzyme